MKSAQEKFTDSYVAVRRPADNKDGFKIVYVYYAPWYMWDIPADRLKKKKLSVLILAILDLVCFFIGALQNGPANTNVVVEFAGVLSLCTLLYQSMGAVQFYAAKPRTTKENFDQITTRLTLFPLIRSILLAVAAGGAVYSIINDGFAVGTLISVIMYLASAALSLTVRLIFNPIPWTTEKNDALETEDIAMEKKPAAESGKDKEKKQKTKFKFNNKTEKDAE